MNITHQLKAFDKETERLVASYQVADDLHARLRAAADMPVTPDDAYGSIPLSPHIVEKVAAQILPEAVSFDRFDWFVETCAVARADLPNSKVSA